MKPIIRKPSEEEREEARSWPIWEKEESEFPWEYDQKETCFVTDGRAIVKTTEGTVEFGIGDYVVFPKGLKCTWKIMKRIRKHYKLE